MKVKFQGNDVTLEGRQIMVGDTAPDFKVVDNNMKDLTLKDTKGVRILLAVPSIDTPVCDLEVKEFNKRASQIKNTTIYTISMDLPFAQARWCAANGVEKVITASDYKYRDFGNQYGVYINELGLLARAAFVVDSSNKVVHVEYCSEITNQPDFEAIIKACESCK